MPIAKLALALAAVMCLIALVDAALGAKAEYFNAWALLGELGRLVTGQGVGDGRGLFVGAERLGPGVRLLAGLGIWVVEAGGIVGVGWCCAWILR